MAAMAADENTVQAGKCNSWKGYNELLKTQQNLGAKFWKVWEV